LSLTRMLVAGATVTSFWSGRCISIGVDCSFFPVSNKLTYLLPLLMNSYLDDRYAHVLDLAALSKWCHMFPLFAEKIREAIARNRNGVGPDGEMRILPGVHFEPGVFRVAGFFDCKDWKTARPGSGPAGDYELAPRRPHTPPSVPFLADIMDTMESRP
jgi:hypothetical protein